MKTITPFFLKILKAPKDYVYEENGATNTQIL
jgi:hypothetical protein